VRRCCNPPSHVVHICPDLSDNDTLISHRLSPSPCSSLAIWFHRSCSFWMNGHFPAPHAHCGQHVRSADKRPVSLTILPPSLDPTASMLRSQTPWSHRELQEAIRLASRSLRSFLHGRMYPSRAFRTTLGTVLFLDIFPIYLSTHRNSLLSHF
jgi:hypothetical protein